MRVISLTMLIRSLRKLPEGKGATLIEMHFISDIWVPCPICQGARYNESILEVTWNGRNIADVLDFSVDEAKEFFSAHKAIQSRLLPSSKSVWVI